jgi:hypothetical protein
MLATLTEVKRFAPGRSGSVSNQIQEGVRQGGEACASSDFGLHCGVRRILSAALLTLAGPCLAGGTRDFEKPFRKADGKSEARAIRAATPPSKAWTWSAEEGFGLWDYLMLPLLPYALAAAAPPASVAGGVATPAHRLETTYQRVSHAVGGLGARYRLHARNHLGVDASWTRYRERYDSVDLNLFNLDATGAFYQDGAGIGYFGLGLAGLSARGTRLGPEARLGGDWFPLKALSLEASIGLALVRGNGLGDFRTGLGISIARAQVRLGYRTLFGPDGRLSGPEAAFALWS